MPLIQIPSLQSPPPPHLPDQGDLFDATHWESAYRQMHDFPTLLIQAQDDLARARKREAFWMSLVAHIVLIIVIVNSPKFEPNKTYRIIRAGDGKIGMYQIVRKGGHLDSEFFPESIGRKSWPNTEDYSKFLRTRGVDFVIAYDSYDRTFKTNEHALLNELSGAGLDACTVQRVGAAPLAHARHYDVYTVRRDC